VSAQLDGQRYAAHVLRIALEARRSGRPLREVLRVPAAILDCAARATDELVRCAGYPSPYACRRAAERAAERCRKRTGWARNMPPPLATNFAAAFHALVEIEKPGRPGNKLGSSRSDETRYIALAYRHLTAARQGNNFLARLCTDDPLERGGPNRTPLGRLRLIRHAEFLLSRDGVSFDHEKLVNRAKWFVCTAKGPVERGKRKPLIKLFWCD
jgi:hypothetical protein